jgi:flagellar hook assembly protein FlgD
MWPMTESAEVMMRIYDLNGQSIYQRRFLAGSNGATAGINNTYVWDGRDDLGRMQATGIYYFYIISTQAGQQKVLGRGNIIIRRTR